MNPLLQLCQLTRLQQLPLPGPPPIPSCPPTLPPCGGDLAPGICPDPLPSSTAPPAKCLSVGCHLPFALGANEHGSNRLCLGRLFWKNRLSDCDLGLLQWWTPAAGECVAHLAGAPGDFDGHSRGHGGKGDLLSQSKCWRIPSERARVRITQSSELTASPGLGPPDPSILGCDCPPLQTPN